MIKIVCECDECNGTFDSGCVSLDVKSVDPHGDCLPSILHHRSFCSVYCMMSYLNKWFWNGEK
jgi:hypothetical protein